MEDDAEEPEVEKEEDGELTKAQKRFIEMKTKRFINRFRNWSGHVGRVAGHVGRFATGLCKVTDPISRGSNNC